jgi:hypothetical protein
MPLNAMHHDLSERCDVTVSGVMATRTRPNGFVLGCCSAASAVAAVSAWCGLEKSAPADVARAPVPVLLHVRHGPMHAVPHRRGRPRLRVEDAC